MKLQVKTLSIYQGLLAKMVTSLYYLDGQCYDYIGD